MVAHSFYYGGLQIGILITLSGLLKSDMSSWMIAMYGYYGIMDGATYG